MPQRHDVFELHLGELSTKARPRGAGRRLPVESDGEVPLDTLLAGGVRDRPDVAAIASRDGDSLWVMAWHYHDDDVPGREARVTLAIPGWNGGPVQPTHYRIDEDHSNAFAVWKRMGSLQEPTTEQVAEMDRRDGLEEAAAPEVRLDGKTLVVMFPLPRAAVSLLEWRR